MNQYTRYLTILILLVQAPSYLLNLKMQAGPSLNASLDWTLFMVTSTIILAAGSMFILWLGERITDKGIGNGISFIILIGIIARLPQSLFQEVISRVSEKGGGMIMFLFEMVFLLLVIAAAILLVQGTDVYKRQTLKLVTITVCTARPGIIIGKGGQEVDKLKEELKKVTDKDIQINIFEVKRPELDAVIVANNIARQVEGKIAYRRAIKMAIANTMRMEMCIRDRFNPEIVCTLAFSTLRADKYTFLFASGKIISSFLSETLRFFVKAMKSFVLGASKTKSSTITIALFCAL